MSMRLTARASATDVCELTALELLSGYGAGELSPVEVTEGVLARAHAVGERLNCFLTIDDDWARAAARDAEHELRSMGVRASRPLLGVPVSVKDLTPTKGLRTTRGSLLLRDWIPDFDPPAIQRLRAAGAILFAKSNTSEGGWKGDAGNRLIGPTANPWSLDRSSGGSSGGAAAAVAAGIGPLATGTDGAGSIRIPASFCGVVGVKPSFGRVPYVPPSADLLAHFGPLARTVADAALLLDVVSGADPRDLFSFDGERVGPDHLEIPPPATRIGFSATLGHSVADPEVEQIARHAVGCLKAAGYIVHELELELEDSYPILDVLIAGAEAASHRDDLDAVCDQLDPGHVRVIERGRSLSAADLTGAQEARLRFAETLRQATSQIDVLIMPTVPITAFELGLDGPSNLGDTPVSGLSWTPFTYPFNLTGQPATTVPAGVTAAGLPVGIQLVGAWRDDLTVLRLAHAYEQLAPWREALHAGVAASLRDPKDS